MATFQINTPFLDEIRNLIDQGENTRLKRKLRPIHYADIAEIIEQLSAEESTYLVKLLKSEKTAEALAEVDLDIENEF